MVKRLEWDACTAHACHCDIVEDPNGEMVYYEDNEELVDYAKSFIEDDTDFIVLYDTGELEYGYDGDGDIFELQ